VRADRGHSSRTEHRAGRSARCLPRAAMAATALLALVLREGLRVGQTAPGSKHLAALGSTRGTATCGCSETAGRLHHRGPLQFDSRAGHDHDRRSRAEGRCHRSDAVAQGATTGSRIYLALGAGPGMGRHAHLGPAVAGKWSVQGAGPDLHYP